MLKDNFNPDLAAKEWLDFHLTDPAGKSDKELSDIIGLTESVGRASPQIFWHFIDSVLSGVSADQQIASFGCGPLESYLRKHSEFTENLERELKNRANTEGIFLEMIRLVDTTEFYSPALGKYIDKFKE